MSDQHSIRLLPGERVLAVEANGTLLLTTHRVRRMQQELGRFNLVSITLDCVSSCALATESKPLLLLLGAAVCVGGFSIMSSGDVENPVPLVVGIMLLVFGTGLLVAYFFTRSAVLRIASAGDDITVPFTGASRQRLAEFVELVESEKLMHNGAAPQPPAIA